MQFNDVIGQDRLQKKLVQIAENNRVHHTQLFLGKRGGGTLPFVIAYAQFLLCENRQANDSCGQCSQCVKMQKLIHPDVHFTMPTVVVEKTPPIADDFIKEFRDFINQNTYGDAKAWQEFIATKKKLNITAAECSELIKTARYKPVEGRFRINIIWMTEFLAKEGNRLLKLLEEPPESTIFLLIAENEERILNTILSRSQIHRLHRLQDSEVVNYLINTKELTEQQANYIALLADGNVNKANELANEVDVEEEANVLSTWLQCIIKDKINLVNFVESLCKLSKEEQKNVLMSGTQLCREAVLLTNSKLPGRLPAAEQKIARWLGKKVTLQQTHQLLTCFEDAHYAIDSNAYSQVVFMNASLTIGGIIEQREVAKQN